MARALVLLLVWTLSAAPAGSFSRQLWAENLDLYARILEHPFLEGLADGTLDRDAFAFYMVQDAHYLREFARALKATADKAPRPQWARLLERHATETLDYEQRLHRSVFAQYGIDQEQIDRFQPAPEAVAYTNHLVATAYSRPFAESMAALLPCYWVYWEVGKELQKSGSRNPLYQKWIAAYASEEYGASVEAVRDIVDQVAAEAEPAARERMKEHFRLGVRYEWMFWDSAYHRRRWPPPSVNDPAARRLRQHLPGWMGEAEVPGLAIALIREGGVVWTEGFGVRSLRSRERVTGTTVFEAASLSKPVFGAAVMQMAIRGEFDLDRPLAEILPYQRLQHDPRYRRITARMVLSHTAGLPNWAGTPLEMIGDPGESWSYSGEGFVFLQKALEQLTGMTLDELVRKEVFDPLGMPASGYVWREAYSGSAATGHDALGEPRPKGRPRSGNAAASLHTTAREYARFVAALLGDELREGTLERMREPQIGVARWGEPEARRHLAWSLGWGVQQGPRGDALWHWGDNGSFRCFVMFYPARRDGLVFFTNSNNGLALTEALLGTAFEDTHWVTRFLDYEQFDSPAFVARRDLRRGFFSETAQQAMSRLRRLRAQSPEVADEGFINRLGHDLLGKEMTAAAVKVFEYNTLLYPESANVWDSLGEAHLGAGELELSRARYSRALELDPEMKSAAAHIEWLDQALEARRHPVTLPAPALRRFAGSYGPRQVTFRQGRLYYERRNAGKEYALTPMGPDTFALEGLANFRLRFVADERGEIVKLVGMYAGGHSDESLRDDPEPGRRPR